MRSLALVLLAVTASPTYTVEPIAMVSAPPTCVHVVPLVERNAVKLLPDRTNRNHTGADPVLKYPSAAPPVVSRCRYTVPLETDTVIAASRELAASDSRIITPALAHPLVLEMLATRAVIVPSPVSFS